MTVTEGRWTVFVCEACGGATGRHKECDNARRVATPVVPIDEAAVERVVARLEELAESPDEHIALALETDDWPHYIAREALRAAAGLS